MGAAAPAPVAFVPPVEPVEDSADDPVPADFCGNETDEELDAAEAAEPPLVTDHTAEERAYRWSRLGNQELLDRIRRRFAAAVDEDYLDEIATDTCERALGSPAFRVPAQPMFPWVYKPGSASRKKRIRYLTRERERRVPFDHVDLYAHAAPPDLDAIPDSLADKDEFLRRATADDTGRRRAVEMIDRNENHEQTYAAIARDNNTTEYAVKQRTARFKRWARKAFGSPVTQLAMVLMVGAGFLYYVSRNVVPEVVHAPPKDLPQPDPVPSSRPAVEDLRAAARVLREEGMRLCGDHLWRECFNALSQAAVDDPRLWDDPAFVKAHTTAVNRTEATAKDPIEEENRRLMREHLPGAPRPASSSLGGP